jgi:hypothetical protein
MGTNGPVPTTKGTAIIRRSTQNTIRGFESAVEVLLLNPAAFIINYNNREFFNTHTPDRKLQMVSKIIWSNHDLEDTVLTTNAEVELGLDMMAARGWGDHLIVEVEVIDENAMDQDH